MRQAGTFVHMKNGDKVDITFAVRDVLDMRAWLNENCPDWVSVTTVHIRKPLPEYSFSEMLKGSDRLVKDEVERLKRERRG